MALVLVRSLARLSSAGAVVFALAAAPDVRANTIDDAVVWLKTLNVPMADAKGFVAASPES